MRISRVAFFLSNSIGKVLSFIYGFIFERMILMSRV